jgi:hypothetical protein
MIKTSLLIGPFIFNYLFLKQSLINQVLKYIIIYHVVISLSHLLINLVSFFHLIIRLLFTHIPLIMTYSIKHPF